MPGVNGQEYQHGNVRINVLGASPIRVKTFSKLNFKVTAEKKPVMDAQGQVIGWTLDNEKIEGSFTLLRSEWLTLKQTLLQQNQAPQQLGILQVKSDWDVSYGNSFVAYQTVKLIGVMFNLDTFDSENNQEPLYVEIPLFITQVLDENGIAPVVYQ